MKKHHHRRDPRHYHRFFTVSSVDGVFTTLAAARRAWTSAGRPQPKGSSVWITEHRGPETIRTHTIARDPFNGTKAPHNQLTPAMYAALYRLEWENKSIWIGDLATHRATSHKLAAFGHVAIDPKGYVTITHQGIAALKAFQPNHTTKENEGTKDLVAFIWKQVHKDYKLRSVDGRKGHWIMGPSGSKYRGAMVDLSSTSLTRAELLDLARHHYGYRG